MSTTQPQAPAVAHTPAVADELDRLIDGLNNLSAAYPMSADQRDKLAECVMGLMALHASICGRSYGDGAALALAKP